MATIDIDDTTLYYERDGHGPAMLFVHGMCGDADVWADQARRFADRCTCVRYDRRGHSRSGRGDAPLGAARHADDAAHLIETLGLDPCLIVGSSSGAVIAVDVAMRHRQPCGAPCSASRRCSVSTPVAGRAFFDELAPSVERAVAAGGPPPAVDVFFSLVCPGLWSTIDEDPQGSLPRQRRHRPDRSAITLTRRVAGRPGRRRARPGGHRPQQPGGVPVVARRLARRCPTPARPTRRLWPRHLRRTARRLRVAVSSFTTELDRRTTVPN